MFINPRAFQRGANPFVRRDGPGAGNTIFGRAYGPAPRAYAAPASRRDGVIFRGRGFGDIGDALDTGGSWFTATVNALKSTAEAIPILANSYAQVRTAGAQARQTVRQPYVAPAPTYVERASNFSRNNTNTLLLVAGGLAAVIVLPRLLGKR